MANSFQFHYVKTPTGTISGPSVLTQTEDAINDLGEYMAQATANAEEALSQASQAVSTANTAQQNASEALSTANSALGSVNTLAVTVNSWNGRITTAEGNASNALTTANQAVGTANQAVDTANSALETAQTAVTTANSAVQSAEEANTAATQAVGTANQAVNTANQAIETAQNAVTDTDAIRQEITADMETINAQVSTVQTAAQNAANSAQAAATAAQNAVDDATDLLKAVVSYEPQTLTEDEQQQARENIGANPDGVTIVNNAETIVAQDVAIGGNASDLASDRGQIGYCSTVPDADANTLIKSGLYCLRGQPTNVPRAPQIGFLLVYSQETIGGSFIAQTFIQITSDSFNYWSRGSDDNGNTWTNWQQILGDECSGNITFTNERPLLFKTNVNRATTPSGEVNTWFETYYDNEGNSFGCLKANQITTGEIFLSLNIYKGSDLLGLQVGLDQDGNAYTKAITPSTGDNTTKIATTAWAIGKSGSRGDLAGYEDLQSQSTALTVNANTQDSCCVTGAVQITVSNGSGGTAWTKTVGITNASATVSLGSSWDWAGGVSPTISANGVLVLHWCGTFGIANFVSATA